MNKDYLEYIKSDKWKAKAKSRLQKDGYKCRTCHSKKRLEVHHATYERFKNERLDDLITLCHDCHSAITKSIRSRRRKKAFKAKAKRELKNLMLNLKDGLKYIGELLLS